MDEKPEGKLTKMVTSFDMFGAGANYFFSGSKVFKTVTGLCFTILGFLFFSFSLYGLWRLPFIPYNKVVEYRTTKTKADLMREKRNFDEYLFVWLYIDDLTVTPGTGFPFKALGVSDLHHYVKSRVILREYTNEPGSTDTEVAEYSCIFSEISDDTFKIYESLKTVPVKKVSFTGDRKPMLLKKDKLIKKEKDNLIDNYLDIKLNLCTKSDHAECKEEDAKKLIIQMILKPVFLNHDRNDVGEFMDDMKQQKKDLWENAQKNYTLPEKKFHITIPKSDSTSKLSIFHHSDINYYDTNSLEVHGQNFKPFLNGSEVKLYGKYDNPYGTGARVIFKWSTIKRQIVFLTMISIRTKEIAGLISLTSLLVLLIYGSYNVRSLELNMMNSLAKDGDDNPMTKFPTDNIVSFYAKQPSYVLNYHLEYEPLVKPKEKAKKLHNKLIKLRTADDREDKCFQAAIEDVYSKEIEMGKIIKEDILFQSQKDVLLSGEVEMLLRVAFMGDCMDRVRYFEMLNDDSQRLTLFGFSRGKGNEPAKKTVAYSGKSRLTMMKEEKLLAFKHKNDQPKPKKIEDIEIERDLVM